MLISNITFNFMEPLIEINSKKKRKINLQVKRKDITERPWNQLFAGAPLCH